MNFFASSDDFREAKLLLSRLGALYS